MSPARAPFVGGVRRGRAEVRALAERLAVEYAGAVPAGRVMAMVHRTNLALAGTTGSARTEILETLVRRLLTDEVVGSEAPPTGRGRSPRTPRQRRSEDPGDQEHG